jgi:hypothetical protein
MSMALAGPATSFATTILSYFSPAKSPFYGVIAFGTAALVLSANKIDKMPWLAVAIPIYLVLLLSLALSHKSRPTFKRGQGEEQLLFARSFAISSALMSFVFTARAVQSSEVAFWANYIACLAQVVVFLAYVWARSLSTEEQSQFNFVQFALISIAFLVGASYSNTQYAASLEEVESGESVVAQRYLLVTAGLYALWAISLGWWIKHLCTLIRIEIPSASMDRTPEK